MSENSRQSTMNTNNPELIVLLPAYNEDRFIGSLVLQLKESTDNVIVIDDGSTDRTAAIARAAGAIVEQHKDNLGKGIALNTGFRRAVNMGANIVVMIDADGQHTPEEIDCVIAPIKDGEADIVVGSRYLEQTSEVPKHRIWGHKLFNFLTKQASGVSVTDSQSGYRAFSSRAINALSFYSDGFSVESEMQFIANEKNLRLVEVPITISYSEEPKRSVVKQGFGVLNGLLYMTSQYRPLLFFGLFGIISILVGLGWGLKVVDTFYTTQKLAVGSAVLSALFVIVGTVSFSTGIILHSIRAMVKNMLSALEKQ